jgi:hypothetical protein
MLWKKVVCLWFALGVAAGLRGYAAGEATTFPLTACLSGQVRTRDAVPIPGVTVHVVLPDPATGDKPGTSVLASSVSGPSGRYEMPPVPVQPCWVVAETTGCRLFVKPVSDLGRAPQDAGPGGPFPVRFDIVMRPAGVFSGWLVDEDGTSVAAAKASLETIPEVVRGPGSIYYPSPVGRHVETDRDGRFRFEDMLPGPYLFSATVRGRVPFRQRVTVPGDGMTARLNSRGGSVEGTVLIMPSGDSCGSATVSLTPKLANSADAAERADAPSARSAMADETGRFVIANLEPGTYAINAWRDNLKPAPLADPHAAEIVVAPEQAVTGFQLFVHGGHTLRGVVLDKDTSRPLPGVAVRSGYLQEGDAVASTTGEDGRFQLSPVHAWRGNARLQIVRQGYSMPGRRADPNGVIWYDAPVAPDSTDATLRIELERNLTIAGNLLREDGGPVHGTTVTLHDEWLTPTPLGEARAADDGSFMFAAPRRGNFRVRALLPGCAVALSAQIAVRDSDVTGAVVRLERGTDLVGTVADPAGVAIAGATVHVMLQVRRESSPAISQLLAGRATTGDGGMFVIANLPASGCTVAAYKSGFAPSRMAGVRAPDGATTQTLKLELRAPHFLAGSVTGSDGKPVEKAFVSINSEVAEDGSTAHATTDSEGRYRAEWLADVPHRVHISHQRHGFATFTDVKVDRADADFQFGGSPQPNGGKAPE